MNIILFDDSSRFRLLPFTHTRPVADIRCGIRTMRERWEDFSGARTSTLTESYLQPVFPLVTGTDNLLVNAALIADSQLAAAVLQLAPGQRLVQDGLLLAARTEQVPDDFLQVGDSTAALEAVRYEGFVHRLDSVWDIFSLNDKAIRADFDRICKDRVSGEIPEYVTVVGRDQIFIEPDAILQPGSIINAGGGPVYIGKEAEVMEGCMLRGPLAICDHAVVKMGAKVYGGTTIGPGCKVGGEVSNVVFFANSNKGHDGFLGNAVIGEWCNLGADTNCSNLKNNYDEVKIWDEHSNKSVRTGLTFCGLLMGDHSKCGINTMFNTGTVAGVSCNIYGSGFPEKFIPSFSWGGNEGMVTYSFDKAMDTAGRMMARRGKNLSKEETEMYQYLFDKTEAQREMFNRS